MEFIRVWLIGYVSPERFVATLRGKPAPWWGFYALVLRSLLDGLLLYLPLALIGRKPPTPSYLTFISTENYYWALIWLTPIVFFMQWLLGGGVMHLMLRMLRRPSNFDQLLNLTGMASLVVSTVLLAWDWAWLFIGGVDQYFLGISHLLIDILWFMLIITGLKRLSGTSIKLGLAVALVALITGLPFAVLIMRSPL